MNAVNQRAQNAKTRNRMSFEDSRYTSFLLKLMRTVYHFWSRSATLASRSATSPSGASLSSASSRLTACSISSSMSRSSSSSGSWMSFSSMLSRCEFSLAMSSSTALTSSISDLFREFGFLHLPVLDGLGVLDELLGVDAGVVEVGEDRFEGGDAGLGVIEQRLPLLGLSPFLKLLLEGERQLAEL